MTTVREARAAFFARAGFDESCYDDAWVVVWLGFIPIVFPNTAARKRAVPLHDVHHALTGYDTSWRGETQQSAWEIGSGCGNYSAAWMINMAALVIGFVRYPSTTWRAFQHGRRSKNLYTDTDTDTNAQWQRVLDDDVDALRAKLHIASG